MAYKHLVQRTIYVAKCGCNEWEDVKDSDPPREKQCPNCKAWVPYVEQSAIGPELVRQAK